MPTPRVVRRRRAIRAAIATLMLALMAVAVVRIYTLRTITRSPEETAGLSDQEAAILKLVNAQRIAAGLQPLKFSARAAVVARGHSIDMAMRHYLSHVSPEGTGPAERLHGESIAFAAVGENIYADDYREFEHLAERAIQRWSNSSEHRAAMLSDKFTETGVGIAHSNDGKTYVTQDFIR
jgi:uncharacterized protein YkwD